MQGTVYGSVPCKHELLRMLIWGRSSFLLSRQTKYILPQILMDIKTEEAKLEAHDAEDSVHVDPAGASVQAAQVLDSKATDGHQRGSKGHDEGDRHDQLVMPRFSGPPARSSGWQSSNSRCPRQLLLLLRRPHAPYLKQCEGRQDGGDRSRRTAACEGSDEAWASEEPAGPATMCAGAEADAQRTGQALAEEEREVGFTPVPNKACGPLVAAMPGLRSADPGDAYISMPAHRGCCCWHACAGQEAVRGQRAAGVGAIRGHPAGHAAAPAAEGAPHPARKSVSHQLQQRARHTMPVHEAKQAPE